MAVRQKKTKSLRAAAQHAVRHSPVGGRRNRSEAMGPHFVADVQGLIADQMRLDPGRRLSVRSIYSMLREWYPTYPNRYSAFRVWLKEYLGYRGWDTKPEDILFDMDEFPPIDEV